MAMLEPLEYAIIEFMIRRKRPVTVKQIAANVIGWKEITVQSTVIQLLSDDMIKDPKSDGHYVIALSAWNAWDHHTHA